MHGLSKSFLIRKGVNVTIYYGFGLVHNILYVYQV